MYSGQPAACLRRNASFELAQSSVNLESHLIKEGSRDWQVTEEKRADALLERHESEIMV
jgi:hypothetical protein